MSEQANDKAFITAENAPSVTIEAIRHLLILQNVSVQLQTDLLVKGGHLSEDEARDYVISLMKKYSDGVHEFLRDELNRAQGEVIKQLGAK